MKLLGAILRVLIRFYQLALSPLLAPACRFEPSCSAYAIEAIERHGPLGGGWLAVLRILRCHPWGGAGYDPVPQHPRHPVDGHRTRGRARGHLDRGLPS